MSIRTQMGNTAIRNRTHMSTAMSIVMRTVTPMVTGIPIPIRTPRPF